MSKYYGKYLVIERIAMGGVAEVFLAMDKKASILERSVVIKKLLPQYSDNKQMISYMKKEARLLAALHHSNIIQILDAGITKDGEPYLVLEYIDGKDLSKIYHNILESKESLPIEAAYYIALQATKALVHVHELTDINGRPYHLIHRDISPSNIMCSVSGDVKLLDFGLTKRAIDVTRAGHLKGKLPYLAPEQIKGEKIDGRADIFALSTVLYELLSGTRRFNGDTEIEILSAITNQNDIPLYSKAPWLPDALVQIIMKAGEYKPAHRYRTAREMLKDLEVLTINEPSFAKGRMELIDYMEFNFGATKIMEPGFYENDDENVESVVITSFGQELKQPLLAEEVEDWEEITTVSFSKGKQLVKQIEQQINLRKSKKSSKQKFPETQNSIEIEDELEDNSWEQPTKDIGSKLNSSKQNKKDNWSNFESSLHLPTSNPIQKRKFPETQDSIEIDDELEDNSWEQPTKDIGSKLNSSKQNKKDNWSNFESSLHLPTSSPIQKRKFPETQNSIEIDDELEDNSWEQPTRNITSGEVHSPTKKPDNWNLFESSLHLPTSKPIPKIQNNHTNDNLNPSKSSFPNSSLPTKFPFQNNSIDLPKSSNNSSFSNNINLPPPPPPPPPLFMNSNIRFDFKKYYPYLIMGGIVLFVFLYFILKPKHKPKYLTLNLDIPSDSIVVTIDNKQIVPDFPLQIKRPEKGSKTIKIEVPGFSIWEKNIFYNKPPTDKLNVKLKKLYSTINFYSNIPNVKIQVMKHGQVKPDSPKWHKLPWKHKFTPGTILDVVVKYKEKLWIEQFSVPELDYAEFKISQIK